MFLYQLEELRNKNLFKKSVCVCVCVCLCVGWGRPTTSMPRCDQSNIDWQDRSSIKALVLISNELTTNNQHIEYNN